MFLKKNNPEILANKKKMKLAFDVHYKASGAKTVCAVFKKWDDKIAKSFIIKYLEEVEAYIPGQFYKRELPCILTVLDDLNLSEIELIIIDGFVVLDDEGKPGLGFYLYEKLERKIPIVGIAKTGFHDNEKNVKKVLRGDSKKPLYITAVGMDVHEAAMNVQDMSGDYRIPDILREVDLKTKEE